MTIAGAMGGAGDTAPAPKVTRLYSKARGDYPETAAHSNTEFAVSIIVERFNLSARFARTVAELAGYGGQL